MTHINDMDIISDIALKANSVTTLMKTGTGPRKWCKKMSVAFCHTHLVDEANLTRGKFNKPTTRTYIIFLWDIVDDANVTHKENTSHLSACFTKGIFPFSDFLHLSK